MSSSLVSVCIVSFNHESYINDCIMSVIAQCCDVKLEILIADDLSEDGTFTVIESLAKEYPHLIRCFHHPERLGSGSKNYQFLLDKAKGDFIAHLDGDDFWLPGKLRLQLKYLKEHPNCPAVYSNALTISDRGLPLGMFNNAISSSFTISEMVRSGNFLNHSSMLYRASLREKIINLDAPFLDYQIHLIFAQQGSLGYLNQVLTAYRVHSGSSIIAKANERVRQSYWEALNSIPLNIITAEDHARGMAEFGRSVFFRSIKTIDISLLVKWLPIILEASPVGNLKMNLLILHSIVRVGFQEIFSNLLGALCGNRLKIFYRR